jgi:hypothetical protein
MRNVALVVVIAGFCPSFGCMHEASNAGARSRNAHESASLAELGPVPSGAAQVCVVRENAGLELLDACEARVHVAVPGHEDETSAQPIAPAKL